MFLHTINSHKWLMLTAMLLFSGVAMAQQGPDGGPGGGRGPKGGKGPGGAPGKEGDEKMKEPVLAKEVKKYRDNVYCFGFAGSFQDSISYMTDIQKLDSVELSEKTKFIMARESYSDQLKMHLKEKGKDNMVCAFFYDTKKSKIEKKYNKLRKRYGKAQEIVLRYVPANEFRYERVDISVFE